MHTDTTSPPLQGLLKGKCNPLLISQEKAKEDSVFPAFYEKIQKNSVLREEARSSSVAESLLLPHEIEKWNSSFAECIARGIIKPLGAVDSSGMAIDVEAWSRELRESLRGSNVADETWQARMDYVGYVDYCTSGRSNV